MTSDERFWDATKTPVYLGAHTRRFSRRSVFFGEEGISLDEPFATADSIAKGQAYIMDLNERWFAGIATDLNRRHCLNRSERAWRLLIGYWLLTFLSASYDRYMRLRTALSTYRNPSVITLHSDSFVAPIDMNDYIRLLKGDLFNHQLYSQILRELGVAGREVQVPVAAREPNDKHTKEQPVCSIRTGLRTLADVLLTRNIISPEIVTTSLGAPVWFQIGIILQSGAKIWPLFLHGKVMPNKPVDPETRRALFLELECRNEFEVVVLNLMRENIPQSFLECFTDYESAGARVHGRAPRAIWSSNAWYFNEPFRHWASSCVDRGTNILCSQHGGNYGSLLIHAGEQYERSFCSSYFTWGWSDLGHMGRQPIPAPALLLAGWRGGVHIVSQSDAILFVSTQAGRYRWSFMPPEIDFVGYLKYQQRFSAAVPAELRPRFRVRLHREDLGWDFAMRWKEWMPEATIEGWGKSFRDSLSDCRIYVCDHLSTTFILALTANKPTLLFWDPVASPLRSDALPYFDALRAAGILFDRPEDAAKALVAAYADIAGWWNDPLRQGTRARFCDQFGRTGEHPLAEWLSLLRPEYTT